MAEIDEKVTICEHRGGEVKEIRVEKYALISTHTARRSFATHLQRSKVPLSSISMALGHKKVTTTMRYLRLGVDENAAIVRRLFGIGLYKITKIIWFCLSGREKSEPFSMKLRTRCGHGKRKIPSEFPLTGFFVPRTGIEPARLAAHAPETCASTYSATWAFGNCGVQK